MGDWIAKITTFSFFQGFTEEDVSFFVRNSHLKMLKTGECLFRAGDFSSGFYFLIDGKLEISVPLAAEISSFGDQPLAVINPGDVIGELGLFGIVAHRVNCVAQLESRLLAFECEQLARLEKESPASVGRLMRRVGESIVRKLDETEIPWLSIMKKFEKTEVTTSGLSSGPGS